MGLVYDCFRGDKMIINEVVKLTNMTKKSIEYYIKKRLICPSTLDNGYRDFSNDDVEKLRRIYVLRKIGLNTNQIKQIFDSGNNELLKDFSVTRKLELKREEEKQKLLHQLSLGKDFGEIQLQLDSIIRNETITEKLLQSFPGYFGRFLCLHFSQFLNQQITTDEQQLAFNEIVNFLDNIPPLELSKELEEFLIESTSDLDEENISDIILNVSNSVEKPDCFFDNYKNHLENYIEYKNSKEFKESNSFKLLEAMKQFTNTSGYNDIFIPAMKRLSPSYADYYTKKEALCNELLLKYPQIENQKHIKNYTNHY